MSRFTRVLLVGLAVLCAAVLLYRAATHRVGAYGVESDFYTFYAPTAQALMQGEILIDEFHPPLYGWVLGGLAALLPFPGPFEAAIVVALAAYAAIVGATFYLARRLPGGSGGAAWLAAALVAFNPTLLNHAFRANIHTFYLALALGTICFVVRRAGIPAGVLAALAVWTRYTLPLSILPLLFLPRREAVRAAVIALAAWVGLGVLTTEVKGGWCRNLNHLNIAAGLYNTEYPTNPGLWISKHQAEFIDLSLPEVFVHRPTDALAAIWEHTRRHGGRLLMDVVILPLGLLALFGLRRKYWGSYRHPLLWWTGMMFGLLVVSYWGDQYVLAFVPLLSLAAALQLADLPPRRIMPFVPVAPVALSCAAGLALLLRPPGNGPLEVKRAALRLRKMPGETVLAEDPRVFYYSGKRPGSMEWQDNRVELNTDYLFDSPYERITSPNLNRLAALPEFMNRVEIAEIGRVRIWREAPRPDSTITARHPPGR